MYCCGITGQIFFWMSHRIAHQSLYNNDILIFIRIYPSFPITMQINTFSSIGNKHALNTFPALLCWNVDPFRFYNCIFNRVNKLGNLPLGLFCGRSSDYDDYSVYMHWYNCMCCNYNKQYHFIASLKVSLLHWVIFKALFWK